MVIYDIVNILPYYFIWAWADAIYEELPTQNGLCQCEIFAIELLKYKEIVKKIRDDFKNIPFYVYDELYIHSKGIIFSYNGAFILKCQKWRLTRFAMKPLIMWSFVAKRVISIFVNLRYLRLKLLK